MYGYQSRDQGYRDQGYQRSGGRGGRGGRGDRDAEYDDDPESIKFRKLFIAGLDYNTKEEGMKQHFEQWGEVEKCVIVQDQNTHRSRGFGFVTFAHAKEVDDTQANRPHTIDGRDVVTKRAMPKEEEGGEGGGTNKSVTKMFCYGVKDSMTEDDLKAVFEEFGAVESVNIVKDKYTGKMKGFCFVSFEDYDSVDKAVLKKRHDVNGETIEVKKAIDKTAQGGGGGFGGGRGGGGRGFGRGRGSYGSSSYGGGGYDDGGYGDSYGYGSYSGGGGGAMKSGGYSQRSQGPYGGSY